MTLAQHLPALQVVVPLVTAPLTVLLRDRRAAFGLLLLAAWASFAIAIALWQQASAAGVVSYAIGSWAPPWGIEYRVDRLSAIRARAGLGHGGRRPAVRRAPASKPNFRASSTTSSTRCSRCAWPGCSGITITGDAFNIFVFLEISSLSTYVLIALGRDRRALVAAYQYLIMGTIGATFIVIGIGLLYLHDRAR